MSHATCTAKERSIRKSLSQMDLTLRKTPGRHWSRGYYPPGYMVVDHRNFVVLGGQHREYDATLADVEDLLDPFGLGAAIPTSDA